MSLGEARVSATRYPSAIARAVWVMVGQIVLSWLGVALALLATDSAAPAAGGLTSSAQVTGEASVWVIIFAIIFTALYAMLAQQVLMGTHWAQVVIWFLAGANAFFGILGLATASHLGWSDVLGVVGIALNVALIVLLATRPSAAHFGRR